MRQDEAKNQLEQLYREYRHIMQYIAYGILEDKGLSEDAVHEAFIRVSKNLHKIEHVKSEKTKAFLIVIVRNVALSMREKERKFTDFEDYWDSIPDKKNVEEIVANKMSINFYVQRIQKLPEKYRDILYLYCVQQCSISEIADMLHLSKETVKKRIQRGRKKLKEV